MKKLKNRIKNNIMYYWSVIGLAVTGSVCHIIHYVKTGRLPPPQKTKYSQEEIRKELRKIAEEVEKEKEAPAEGPGPEE